MSTAHHQVVAKVLQAADDLAVVVLHAVEPAERRPAYLADVLIARLHTSYIFRVESLGLCIYIMCAACFVLLSGNLQRSGAR